MVGNQGRDRDHSKSAFHQHAILTKAGQVGRYRANNKTYPIPGYSGQKRSFDETDNPH